MLILKKIFLYNQVKKNSGWKVYAALSPRGLNEHIGRDRIQSKALCESGAEVSKGKERKNIFCTPVFVAFPPYFIIQSSIQL